MAVGAVCLAAGLLSPATSQAREVSSYARVNDDASLRINGRTIHLAGIHVPDTGTTCQTWRNPPVCGSRAVVALRFKIDGFVRCELLSRNNDRSFNGWCRVGASSFEEGEDLAAYLLQQGWAVALPDASFEYLTMEKIARARGLGLWGIPVDNIRRR
ncbi:nuclease-like protein [Parahaliea aestuarii]|uniref:Nuclease-like protein n=1 Tax=Parahaliea aestuarii TaxID=1852021 RepID=A0A5C9A579_9GAMM|nr:nuclease-like protein [Parahaliea aestuarii]